MWLWILGLSFFSYGIIKYWVAPMLVVLFYKKQGLDINRVPTFGHIAEVVMNQKLHGDVSYKSKTMARKNPNYLGEAFAIGSYTILHLMDVKLIREHLLKEDLYRKAYPRTFKHFLGKGGLMFADGDLWKKNRKFILSQFTMDFHKKMIPIIHEAVMKGINRIKNGELKNKVILPELELISGEIVGKIFFGMDLNKFEFNGMPLSLALTQIVGLIDEVNLSLPFQMLGENFFDLGLLPSHRKIIEDCRGFRNLFMELIQQKKKDINFSVNDDLISLLIGTQQLEDPNMRFSDEEILDLFLSVYFPGIQNPALSDQMLLYCLGRYQESIPELKEEIANIYNRAAPLTYEALSRMDLLTGFIKEHFRCFLATGGNLPRVALKDHMVGDIMIKKGTVITIDQFYNFHHPRYFETPEKFNPKRWLEKKEFDDPFVFIPFGEGPRACIGQQLTWIQFRILVCEMLRTFDQIRIPEDYKLEITIKRRTQPKDDIRLDLSAPVTSG